jgi:hypothetical protein
MHRAGDFPGMDRLKLRQPVPWADFPPSHNGSDRKISPDPLEGLPGL